MHHRSHSQTHNDQLSPLQPQFPYLKCTFGSQYSIIEPTKQQLKKNIFKRYEWWGDNQRYNCQSLVLTKDTREVRLIQPPHHLMWINSLRVGEAERGAAFFPVTGEGMWWSPSTKKALICESHEGKEPAAPPHSFQVVIASSRGPVSLIAPSHGKSHAIFSTQKHNWVKRQRLCDMPLFLMYYQSSCTPVFRKAALNLYQCPQPFPEPHGQAFICSENTTQNPHTTAEQHLSHNGRGCTAKSESPGTELPFGHWPAMCCLQARGQ